MKTLKHEHAVMHIGIGLIIGIAAALLLHNIVVGVALGLVFALTTGADKANPGDNDT